VDGLQDELSRKNIEGSGKVANQPPKVRAIVKRTQFEPLRDGPLPRPLGNRRATMFAGTRRADRYRGLVDLSVTNANLGLRESSRLGIGSIGRINRSTDQPINRLVARRRGLPISPIRPAT